MSESAPALDDLLPAHALGALDGEDRAALEQALGASAGGVELAARAASWTREIERSRRRWRRSRRLRSCVHGCFSASRRRRHGPLRSRRGRPSYLRLQRSPWTSQRAPPWLLRAVAAVLLAVVGWGAFDRAALHRELESLRSNDQQLAAQLAAMHQQLKSSNVELARLESQARIVSAPDMHPVVLAGLESAPRSTARTFVSPRDGKALFYAYGLPAARRASSTSSGSSPTASRSRGVSSTSMRRANAALLVDHVAPVESIQAWAVTVEPAGGLPAPSGAMVLKG
jgi:hypothetical protein